jgi:hypothetical protein
MDICWRRQGTTPQDHTTFQVGHRAFFLCPLGSRQHDVGKRSRFGQKDVGDHQQVQRP